MAELEKGSEKRHLPIEEHALAAIRRASATGLPYGDENWVNELAGKLKLDLPIRPRGRPRKNSDSTK